MLVMELNINADYVDGFIIDVSDHQQQAKKYSTKFSRQFAS